MPDIAVGTERSVAVRTPTGTIPAGTPDSDDYASARAARKAQTRSEISQGARNLFAEHGFDAVTVADIAAAASVSPQTVYSHFATKEDLFFEGRTGWFGDPAQAVRSREPGTPPLLALRDHLIEAVWNAVYFAATPDGHLHTAAVEASPAPRVHELTLFDQAERQLAEALAEAWASHPERAPSPSDTPMPPLVSATWLAAARVAVASYRSPGEDPVSVASEATAMIDQILCQLETV